MAERAFEEEDEKRLEKPKKGDGVASTPILDAFGRNLNLLAKNKKLDPVIGREKQVNEIVQILNKRKKNNVLIIGESGVGKSCLAEGLAIKIVNRDIDRSLWDKKIYEINMTLLVSGTKYRGEFESKMKALVAELIDNPSIIVFIDEIHTVIGAGGASGGLDASNILKPALARGEISCIGATTIEDHKKYLESDKAFDRRFEKVWLTPSSKEDMMHILTSIKQKYEDFHGVIYDDEVLKVMIDLCDRYIPYRNFPDKAIDVMDQTGSLTKLKGVEEPQICKDLEAQLKEALKNKAEFAVQQRYEEAAKMRDEERRIKLELDEHYRILKEERAKNKVPVTISNVTEVISKHSGIPLSKLAQGELERLKGMESELLGSVIGQDHAVKKIVQAIKRSKMGVQDPNKPFVFLFLGRTGTGKTYLAKTLAKYLFDLDSAFIRLDMSEYMEKFNVSKLIGSPPGYVGHEEKGFFTEKVKNNPYSLILLDEIEKAHTDVFNIFLQVFEDGKLTDSHGSEINFRNCIIIMTSNIGTKKLDHNDVGFDHANDVEANAEQVILDELKKHLPPELLNRIDEKIVFRSFSKDDIKKIVELELKVLRDRLSEKNMIMTLKPSMIQYLADNGFDEVYGARPLKRLITSMIENEVAQFMLDEKLKNGDTFKVSYDTKKKKVDIHVNDKE